MADELDVQIDQLRIDIEDKRTELRELVARRNALLDEQDAMDKLASMTEPEKAALIKAAGIESTSKVNGS